MGFLKEFKEFAVKGNVIDLAVGVVIGGAFGKIVTSLVEDIITAIKYGSFLAAAISFIVVAFALFLMIKGINKLKKAPEVVEEAPAGPTQEELLAEIRDLLKNK